MTLARDDPVHLSLLYAVHSRCDARCGPWQLTQRRLTVSHRRWSSCPHMSHVSGRMRSRARCPNRLHLKQATGVRRSSNGDTMMPPPPNVTLSDFSSFSASSFVATLITADACCPLGLGRPSQRIVHTSTPFSVPKRSIADLLTLPLSASLPSGSRPRSEESDTRPVGKGGRPSCVGRCCVRSASPFCGCCGTVAAALVAGSCCRASSALVVRFLVHLSGGGGGVDGS